MRFAIRRRYDKIVAAMYPANPRELAELQEWIGYSLPGSVMGDDAESLLPLTQMIENLDESDIAAIVMRWQK